MSTNNSLKIFNEIEFCWRQIFEILIILFGHVSSHTKFGPNRFDIYWIQTDKQADKHQDKQSIYIDV